MKAGKAGGKAGGDPAAKQELKSAEQVLRLHVFPAVPAMFSGSSNESGQLLYTRVASTYPETSRRAAMVHRNIVPIICCRWQRNGGLRRRRQPDRRASTATVTGVPAVTAGRMVSWAQSTTASARVALAGGAMLGMRLVLTWIDRGTVKHLQAGARGLVLSGVAVWQVG